jgi:hypothetical protein
LTQIILKTGCEDDDDYIFAACCCTHQQDTCTLFTLLTISLLETLWY